MLDEIGDLASEAKTDLEMDKRKAKEKLDRIVKLVDRIKK